MFLTYLDESPLLWAHYGDKHRGMCLGLDVPDDVARVVDYVEERLPWEQPTQGFMEKLLWTKFEPWSYEAEVRAFVAREEQEDGRYFIHFGEKLRLRQVIVGHRCSVERGEVSAAMASYPESVPIIKARLSRTSFNVEENPYGFMV